MIASICRVLNENPLVHVNVHVYTFTCTLNCIISSEYKSRFRNEETVSFTLRVMVGVIILYDHLHPVGAFVKKAPIDVSELIRGRSQFIKLCLINFR